MVGMRTIFFGTPDFAVPTLQALLDSSHSVVGVICQPDRPKGRGQRLTAPPTKELAVARGVPVVQPVRMKDEALLATLRDWRADVGVVAAYGRILPKALLDLPRMGFVNVHASLLPAYRGAAPVHRAVMAGEPMTGVTIMQVVEALDAGDMLAAVSVPIGADMTSEALERELAQVGARLLVRVLDDLPAYMANRVAQDPTQATYAQRLEKHEGEIDWSLTAGDIHNRIRGLTPWPLAFTFVGAERLVVRRSSQIAKRSGDVGTGTVLAAGADGVVVACGNESSLTLLEVQPEGRRAMAVRDYLAGHPINIGQRLGRVSA